jgi:hypothetical protein
MLIDFWAILIKNSQFQIENKREIRQNKVNTNYVYSLRSADGFDRYA